MFFFDSGFDVLTAVVVKSCVFWDITTCSLLKVNRRFGGDMFLRKVDRISTGYMTLYPTRCDSSYIFERLIIYESRNTSVGIVSGYELGEREVGVRVPVGARIFSSPCRPDRLWGPLTSYPIGTGASFPGGKLQVSEFDHSLLASADVKKMWIYTSTPPYIFMA
jgi:hypothetical protein